MIKAVIFDCFGVLVTESWTSFKAEHFGHDQELFGEASSLSNQADAGLITHEDAVKGTARLAGLSPKEVSEAIHTNSPNEPLFEYISELKQDYKIGMLSNAAADWLAQLFTPEQLALFDEVALSYESGFVKPKAKAYEIIADQLGVEIGDCIMVDDREEHCAGARDAGMQAVLYTNFSQTKDELNKLLSNTKR